MKFAQVAEGERVPMPSSDGDGATRVAEDNSTPHSPNTSALPQSESPENAYQPGRVV